MDLFKEYGTTAEEIQNAIQDAIAYIEAHGDTENLAERLRTASEVLKRVL